MIRVGPGDDRGSALGKLVQAAATSFFTHAYASEDDKDSKVHVHVCTLYILIQVARV